MDFNFIDVNSKQSEGDEGDDDDDRDHFNENNSTAVDPLSMETVHPVIKEEYEELILKCEPIDYENEEDQEDSREESQSNCGAPMLPEDAAESESSLNNADEDSFSIFIKSEPPDEHAENSPINIKIDPDASNEETTETKATSQPEESSVVMSASSVEQPVASSAVQSTFVAQTNTVSAPPQNSGLNLLPIQNGLMMQPNTVVFVVPNNVPNQPPYQFIMPNAQNINQISNQAVGIIPISNGTISQMPTGTISHLPTGTIPQMANGSISQVANTAISQMTSGTLSQMASGTISQLSTGTISQVGNNTISQITSGSISQINGTIPQMTTGTISQMPTGTISQISGTIPQMSTGTISQLGNGTVSQITSSTISQISGTISQMTNGTISQMPSGTVSQMTSGTISQISSGTISQMATGTISQITSPNLSLSNTLIPQTQQNLSISNSFLSQTNQQNIQMAATSMLPQSIPISGSFLQNMQISNGFFMQTNQQNMHIPNAVLPQGTQATSMSNNLLPQTIQQNIQMTNTPLPPVTQSITNSLSSQTLQNMNVSKPLIPLLPQTVQQNVQINNSQQSQVMQSIPNNLISQTVQQNFQISEPQIPWKSQPSRKNIKPTSTKHPKVTQSNPSPQTTSKILKPLLPKPNQDKTLSVKMKPLEVKSIPVSKNLISQSNQQHIQTTSALLPKVSQSLTITATSQQSMQVSNPLMPQVSQSLILPNNVLPLTSQQSFTLAGNLLPQTVQSNNLLSLTSQNISLNNNMLPQTVQSNSLLPLSSQNVPLTSNLLPQTVKSNSILPITSQQSFTLAGNLIPQTVQSNNVLPLTAQNISLTSSILPQTVQSLINSSPQTVQKASDTPQKGTASVSQPKLRIEPLKKLTKNKPIAPKTPLHESENDITQTVSEPKYLTRSAKRELDIQNKKTEEKIKTLPRLIPILPPPTGEFTSLDRSSSDEKPDGEKVGKQDEATADDGKESVQTLGNAQCNEETETNKNELENDNSDQQMAMEVDNVEQRENEVVSRISNPNISGSIIVSSTYDQLALLIAKPAEKNANGMLECPKCYAELPNAEHFEMHNHIYHNNNYLCICGKGFESLMGLKLHRHCCTLFRSSSSDEDNTKEESYTPQTIPQVDLDPKVVDNNDSLIMSGDSKQNNNDVVVKEEVSKEVEDEDKKDKEWKVVDEDGKTIDEIDAKKCPHCKMNVRNMEAHLKHCRLKPTVYNYSCKICGRKFFRQFHLKMHMQVHSDERAVDCKICKKSFKTITNLYIHMRIHARELTQSKQFKCDKCPLSFRLKSDLKKHTLSHSNNIPVYRCDKCNILFASEKALNTHIETHFDANPFQCALCFSEFNTKVKLTRHMFEVHDRDESNIPAAPSILTDISPKPVLNVATNIPAVPSILTDISPKPVVNVAANIPAVPSIHTDISPKPVLNVAAKVTVNKMNKTDNLLPPAPPSSDQSSSRFEDNFETSLTNENNEVYKCKLCTCLFASVSLVKNHLKTHYSKQLNNLDGNFETSLSKQNDRVYNCKLCGCRFSSEKLVKKHVRSHFLKRAFTCNICGCTYNSYVKLKRHKMYHDESHFSTNDVHSKPDRIVEEPEKTDEEEQHEENIDEMAESDEMYVKIESSKCYDSTDKEVIEENINEMQEPEEINIKIESVESSACFPFSVDFSSLDNDFSEPDENVLTPEIKLEETDGDINADITKENSVESRPDYGKYCPKCKLPIRNLEAHSVRCPLKYSRLCKPCGRYFKNSAGYNIHCYKIHRLKTVEASKFQCKKCPATFTRVANLFCHEKTHSDPDFICYICDRSFPIQKKHKHLSTHFVSNNSNDLTAQTEVKESRICPKISNFPCNLCDKICYSHNKLVAHLNFHFISKRSYKSKL